MNAGKWAYRALSICAILAMLVITQCNSLSEPEYICAGKKVSAEKIHVERLGIYLTQCGVNSLDGDSDGLPCERDHCD